QAPLPRQGLVRARPARPAGAERPAVPPRGAADRPARPLPDDLGAREVSRSGGGRGSGSARVRSRLLLALALVGERGNRRRRGARSARVDRDGRAPVRRLRGPRRPRPRISRPRRTRAKDPASPLLRRTDPVADRTAGRDLADARVALDPSLAREDPRG